MEHGIDQGTALHQHLGAGAHHRIPGGIRFRGHTSVHLAVHGGLEIEQGARFQLTEGISAGGDRLSPQRRLGPGRRHFTTDDAGQIALQRQLVDHQQAAVVPGPDLQPAAIELTLHRHQG